MFAFHKRGAHVAEREVFYSREMGAEVQTWVQIPDLRGLGLVGGLL